MKQYTFTPNNYLGARKSIFNPPIDYKDFFFFRRRFVKSLFLFSFLLKLVNPYNYYSLCLKQCISRSTTKKAIRTSYRFCFRQWRHETLAKSKSEYFYLLELYFCLLFICALRNNYSKEEEKKKISLINRPPFYSIVFLNHRVSKHFLLVEGEGGHKNPHLWRFTSKTLLKIGSETWKI